MGYRETRNEIRNNDFMLTITTNLLLNLSARNNFIHSLLGRYKIENKKVDSDLKIASSLYVCSLITCWETFFRDLFIFISNHDDLIRQRIAIGCNSENLVDLSIGEFVASKYNFQNLLQTREAFDFLFQKTTVKLSEYFSNEVFGEAVFSEYIVISKWIQDGNLNGNLDEALVNAFKLRHRIMHDANYLMDWDPEMLAALECVFQVVPQFFISHISEKYSQKRVVFHKTEKCIRITDTPTVDEVPYIFSSKDFMANDFQISEES